MSRTKRIFRFLFKFILWTGVILIVLFLFFLWRIQVPTPKVNSTLQPSDLKRIKVATDSYQVGKNWLRKNKEGIWEMYIEGSDYERGVVYGVLAKELMEEQEDYFIAQINEIIPHKVYLQFIKMFVAWFNKDIYKYVPAENLREIYGVSRSFSDKYDYIGPKYYRILNYHAAHDIGHALTDFQLVGCTSFAVNKSLSADSTLLIGRNFDFYMGDDFAKNKLLLFVKPDSGYAFASYSWAGFTGVVSGMNEKGLTVTINAAKSDIPFAAKDPISLLAREILQYSKNIDEATTIARKRETFVSETLLIGSAEDNKAALIEKSPNKLDIFYSPDNLLICSNHYQGDVLKNDDENVSNIANSDSKFRYDRMKQLLDEHIPLNADKAADVLRNKEGLDGKSIGYGNPKAIDQLLAHHSVIFKPAGLDMWVSTMPYQDGEYVHYNLRKVLSGVYQSADSLDIPADAFTQSEELKKFEAFKITKQKIYRHNTFGQPLDLTAEEIKTYISNNPNSFVAYMSIGEYYRSKKQYDKAIFWLEESLKHEVASKAEELKIKKIIEECQNKLKN
ncbi:MAG: peptidase C45 [Bacteroidetes bacterium]|nr:peptidase C45 [Bacteroidota bacterium]